MVINHPLTNEYRQLEYRTTWQSFGCQLYGGRSGSQNGCSAATHVLHHYPLALLQSTNFNAVSILSHIRRVCTPLDRVGRGSRPRQLHPSHYGFLCPVETPEGPACGLIDRVMSQMRPVVQGVCTGRQGDSSDRSCKGEIVQKSGPGRCARACP